MRKIRGKTCQDILTIPSNPTIIGEFLGVFAGDGYFFFDPKGYHYTFLITLHAKNDLQYVEYLETMFRSHFNKEVRKYYVGNSIRIMFESKKLFNFINSKLEIKNKTYNVRLKGRIDDYGMDFLLAFVRGLMDTDGYVREYSIGIKMASKYVIYQISKILKKIDIENKISIIKDPRPNCKTLYQISINKNQLSNFYGKINFSNPKKREKLIKIMRRPGVEVPKP